MSEGGTKDQQRDEGVRGVGSACFIYRKKSSRLVHYCEPLQPCKLSEKMGKLKKVQLTTGRLPNPKVGSRGKGREQQVPYPTGSLSYLGFPILYRVPYPT